MIKIPNLKPSSRGASLQGVSVSAAIDPALSLSHVAKGINDAGQAATRASNSLEKHDQEIQGVQDDADRTEIRNMLKKEHGDFRLEMQNDYDYKSHKSKWQKRLEAIQSKISGGKYSQKVLDFANNEFANFKTDTSYDVAANAQRGVVSRSKDAYANGYGMALDSYDSTNPAKSLGEFDELIDMQGWMTPEQKKSESGRFRDAIVRKHTFAEVHEDPRGWLERNPKPKGDMSLWNASKGRAHARLRELVGEQSDMAINGILEGTIDEKDIVALTPDLDSKGRRSINNFMKQFQDEKFQERLKSPKEQSRVAGQVSDMINKYNPNGKSYDSDYVAIKTEMQSMAKGALRDEYEKVLNDLRDGKEREMKTVKDWTFKQMREYVDTGVFGEIPKEKKIEYTNLQYIQDGFINEDNLKALGFRKHDIEKIMTAEEVVDFEGINKSEVTPGAQWKLFKELWKTRDLTSKPTAWQLQIGSSLSSGKEDSVARSVEDPKSVISRKNAEESIWRKSGQLEIEVGNYFKLNPNATMKEAQEKLEQLGVDVAAGDTNQSWIPSRPESSQKSAKKVVPTFNKTKGAYKVVNKTRDQIVNFKSKPGKRMVSLDFNDADNKAARGIEIKVPDNVTDDELEAAKAYAREVQEFYKLKGVDVPIRHGDGIKRGGRGISGVFHTEPFFISNDAARKAIEKDPKAYAEILGRTLGNIDGVTFIPPHKENDPGASNKDINERDFAKKYIIPNL